jgi:cob(I)alamin adenosyltransferase
MSACSRTAWTLARSRIPTSRTQLPFLYQTATIQRCPPTTLPFARRHVSFRPHNSSPRDDSTDDIPFEKDSIPFEKDSIPFEKDSIPFEKDSIPFETDSIPFEYEEALPPALDDLKSARKTTITGSERKAFEKLYKKFSTQNRTDGNRGPGEEDDQVADEYYEDDDDGSAKRVDAVFDEVFKETPLLKKTGTAHEAESLVRKLEAETRPVTSKIPAEEKEEVARLKQLSRAEYERVNLLLKNAQTDIELWEVLEREVFAPIRVLDLDGQKKKKKKKTAANADGKNKNNTEESHPGSGSGHIGADSQKNKARQEVIRAVWTPRSEIPPGPRRSVGNIEPAGKQSSTKSKPSESTPTTPQILFQNYPRHLTAAASLMHTHFPTSQLPLSLLPMIKSLGRSSYALGVTPALYNHLLRCAWTQQQSYSLIDDLLTEMNNSAIEFDAATAETLRLIVQEFDDARAGKLGRELQIVFGMQRFTATIERIRTWRRRALDALGEGVGEEKARRMGV